MWDGNLKIIGFCSSNGPPSCSSNGPPSVSGTRFPIRKFRGSAPPPFSAPSKFDNFSQKFSGLNQSAIWKITSSSFEVDVKLDDAGASEKLRDHEKPRIARLSAGNKAVEPRELITEDDVKFGIIPALK